MRCFLSRTPTLSAPPTIQPRLSAMLLSSLFAITSSQERKQWGILVWTMALEMAPAPLLPQLFTNNVMHCLVTVLGSKESYLRKICDETLKAFEQRMQNALMLKEGPQLAPLCVKAILEATDYADVDSLTKTKLLAL